MATMDDTPRTEYPAMLGHLQPTQAVTVLNDRLKRINKINAEIAEWLQERRRVEEQYVQSLHRLMQFRVPNSQSDLGVFHGPWSKIISAVEAEAYSHHQLASRIEKDIEGPLRAFTNKSETLNLAATSDNLTSMARDLEDAQKKLDAQTKKSGKSNAQKLDAALSKLETATQQWDAQAPFIFESLQAFDEQRINQLRDLFTQYQTFETEKAQRGQATATETLAAMLEISTDLEIASFKERIVAGKPKVERRAPSRQGTNLTNLSAAASTGPHEDTTSEHSVPHEVRPEPKAEPEPEPKKEEKKESKLRSKIGTVFGRRRQSTHSGFGQLSPNKGPGSFSRTNSAQGRLSPRASSTNIAESTGRLSALPETPGSPEKESEPQGEKEKTSHDGTNGLGISQAAGDAPAGQASASAVNGTSTDAPEAPAAAGISTPQPQQKTPGTKDSEGFTIPPPMDDPISQAQRDAAGEETAEQLFKLNISSSPIVEEDPEASKAAMSNVASTLTQMAAPSRKLGTVRGRRDVRNTVYFPSPSSTPDFSGEAFAIPGLQSANTTPKPPAVATLASEASIAATSDTQSVRSANSLGSLAQAKHPEMGGPGLSSSIIETVSATFEDGVVKSAKISGEIAFSYHSAEADARDRETIRINNFPNLEAIGPNRIFVHNVAPDRPDEFTLDLSHLNKTSTAFTYRLHTAEGNTANFSGHAPLMIRPAWKPQGDKLGLLLQYSLNPACQFPSPVTLHNVVFIVTYEGARATGAQTKPSGTHLKEKQLVYWRLGDVTLTSDVQKIVCRIIGAEGAEPKPGQVEARWEHTLAEGAALGSGISVARLEEDKGKAKEIFDDDPFADDDPAPGAEKRWVDVSLVRKVVSGKYDAA